MGCLCLVVVHLPSFFFFSLTIVSSSEWQATDSDDIIGPESFDLHNSTRFRLRYNITAFFRHQFSIFSHLMIARQTKRRLSEPLSTVGED